MMPAGKYQLYPLLPYSRLVWDMMQTNPDIYSFRLTLRFPKGEVDAERLKCALLTSVGNHPVFSMNIDENGMQYFQPQDDILHGRFHSFDVKETETSVCIDVKINRILGDAYSFGWLLQELCRAYDSHELFADDYLGYLDFIEQYKLTSQYRADEQFLQQEYGGIVNNVHPAVDTDALPDGFAQAGLVHDDMSGLRSAFSVIGKKYQLTVSQFLSLCAGMAIAEYNNTGEAALTWAYLGRETAQEMTIFGSLHKDIPLKIRRQEHVVYTAQTNDRLLRQFAGQVESGIEHSACPFTLLKPNTEVWNYAVNVIDEPSATETNQYCSLPVEIVFDENTDSAYSLLDIQVSNGEQLIITYRYSAAHYKESSIRRFARLVHKYAKQLSITE